MAKKKTAARKKRGDSVRLKRAPTSYERALPIGADKRPVTKTYTFSPQMYETLLICQKIRGFTTGLELIEFLLTEDKERLLSE